MTNTEKNNNHKDNEPAENTPSEAAQQTDKPVETERVNKKLPEAPAASTKTKNTEQTSWKKRYRLPAFMAFICITLILIIIWCIYYAQSFKNVWLNEQQQLKEKIQQLELITNNNRKVSEKNREQNNLLNQLAIEQNSTYEQRLKSAEERIQVQNKRLLSLSTTTREDWLLAEAEYLLKLANQRILIERNIEGADALLSEADGILRDLDDPDLFPLRQAIQTDLAELRLTAKVDVQGIYLTLVALAIQIEKLPILPNLNMQPLVKPKKEQVFTNETTQTSFWSTLTSSLTNFLQQLQNYIRITDHNQTPTYVLTPESALYLQQNLRLMMERSQLALMREQPDIYLSSLEQAEIWIQKHFPKSEQRQLFLEQLNKLKNIEITRQLPDITDSLELLHLYIDQLHKLNGVSKPDISSINKNNSEENSGVKQ